MPDNRFDSASWVRRILSGLVIVTGVDDQQSLPVEECQDWTWEEQGTCAGVVEIDTSGLSPPGSIAKMSNSESEGAIVSAHFSVEEYRESSNVRPSNFHLVEATGQWYIFKSSLAYLHYCKTTCFAALNSDIQPLLIDI
jgi:hypothetical protein